MSTRIPSHARRLTEDDRLLLAFIDRYQHATRLAQWIIFLRVTLEMIKSPHPKIGIVARAGQVMLSMIAWPALLTILITAEAGWTLGGNPPHPAMVIAGVALAAALLLRVLLR